MPEYRYVAIDENRQRHTGSLTAPDRATAMRILSQNYPVVTQLDSEPQGVLHRLGFGGRVRGEELVAFTQTLATLIDAGLTLKNALDLLARELRGPAMNSAIVQLSNDLGQGQSISQAMGRHPHIFDKLYRSLILAGETGGRLPNVLNRLGDFLERSLAVRNKLKAAMVYPCLVMGFAVVLGSVILTFGVPQLESLYANLNVRLPMPTLVLIGVFRFLASNILLMALGLGLLGWGVNRLLHTESGGFFMDQLKLDFGPTKDLFRNLYTARFTETLGTLYTAGVPLLKTLDIIADTMGNQILASRLHKVAQEVQDGTSLAKSLHHYEIVADLAVGLIEAGEEAGQLDPILARLSRYYEGKFHRALETLASIAEPALIIGVGTIVAIIIICLGLPFMNLASLLA